MNENYLSLPSMSTKIIERSGSSRGFLAPKSAADRFGASKMRNSDQNNAALSARWEKMLRNWRYNL
jgi:hypothetical protein